jgi:hypothetical protein
VHLLQRGSVRQLHLLGGQHLLLRLSLCGLGLLLGHAHLLEQVFAFAQKLILLLLEEGTLALQVRRVLFQLFAFA